MNISDLKLKFSQYFELKEQADASFDINSVFTDEKSLDKFIDNIFSQYDMDSNAQLDDEEIRQLVDALNDYNAFLDEIEDDECAEMSMEKPKGAVLVDWEELANEVFDLEEEVPEVGDVAPEESVDEVPSEESVEDAPLEDALDEPISEEELSESEIKEKEYEDKENAFEMSLLFDENVTQEQIDARREIEENLELNLEAINALLENKDNLTDEQKQELASLIAQRKELLTNRTHLEWSFYETVNETTGMALNSMQQARKMLDDNQLQSLDSLQQLEIGLQETIENYTPQVQAENAVPVQQSSSGGGSTGGRYSSNPGNSNAQIPKVKTKEELQADLVVAQGELETNKDALNEITNETDPRLVELKAGVDTAYQNYQNALNEIMPELAQELDNAKIAKEAKEKEINDTQVLISDKQVEISNLQTNLDSINGNISSYESALANLESSKNSPTLSEEQKAEIQRRIDDLNDKLENARSKRDEITTSLETAQTELGTLETNLSTYQTELETLVANYDAVQAKVDNLQNVQLTALKDAYIAAEANYDKTKADLLAEAQKAVDNSQTKINELQKLIDEKENQEIERQGRIALNGNPLTFNGQNYDCVVPEDQIDHLLGLIKDNKAMTREGHNDMCLAFSTWYGQYLLGEVNDSEFQQFRTPGVIHYGKSGAVGYDDFDDENKDTILGMVYEDISNGKPSILQVGANENRTRHYVVVVGLREGAPNPPTESDLLIIDTYDGRLEGMGDYGTRDMITGADCHKKYSGYQVYRFED